MHMHNGDVLVEFVPGDKKKLKAVIYHVVPGKKKDTFQWDNLEGGEFQTSIKKDTPVGLLSEHALTILNCITPLVLEGKSISQFTREFLKLGRNDQVTGYK